MNKLLAMVAGTMLFSQAASADYTMHIPQKPGGGTSTWAEIISGELEKHLGEEITLVYHPGARDIPGFNEWHNNVRQDDNSMMVSHGGNGVSFLQEQVDYNYAEYDSIGLMNLNIIAGKLKGTDFDEDGIRFSAGSGQVPEAFAFTLLYAGPGLTVDEYITWFKDNVTWVKGMSGGERRLAFKRGELNGTRENPAAYKKHVAQDPNAEVWFHHGILQADGSHADDPNYPGLQMEILFKERWGVEPSGEFYEAYKLVKSWRDGLQKAIWVNKGNPNTEKLRAALETMADDPESQAVILKAVGQYDWVIGEAGNGQVDTLMTFITDQALKDLIAFNTEALGLASVYKPQLVE